MILNGNVAIHQERQPTMTTHTKVQQELCRQLGIKRATVLRNVEQWQRNKHKRDIHAHHHFTTNTTAEALARAGVIR